MYRIRCDLQIRGNDWGVSLGAGRVVDLDEDLGNGKSLGFLIEQRCVTADHFEAIEPPAAAPHAAYDVEGEE